MAAVVGWNRIRRQKPDVQVYVVNLKRLRRKAAGTAHNPKVASSNLAPPPSNPLTTAGPGLLFGIWGSCSENFRREFCRDIESGHKRSAVKPDVDG